MSGRTLQGGVTASAALARFREQPSAATLAGLGVRLAADDRVEKRALVACDVALVLWWTGLEPEEVAEELWGDGFDQELGASALGGAR